MLKRLLLASLALPLSVSAAPLSMDLDALSHGEIVNDQFDGVTVSGTNPNRGFDYVAAFDTNKDATRDPDLESPWSGGNLPTDTDLGNILIIAENNVGADDGVLDLPDDEGTRPNAGTISFAFDVDLFSFSFVLVDIEGPSEYGIDGGFFASFYDGDTLLESVGFGALVGNTGPYGSNAVFGDNTINQINPITASLLGTTFDRVDVTFGGSGAIGGIQYQVPAPATLALLGLGLVGVALRKRRTN
ncbi:MULTISPECIES: PEP-CTERM sorting domain-containing protein [Corallincola]|uniref:PEP-CTERM sorting domain-containing protein n=2 Tax=Corallincola TaxID=1775176 RepID=A0A368NSA2_9GAMM|nr:MULTISPECIES: PEP-CTERM sorting domain-containing protein [Corallincola]RCU52705.1 PEP-CTERM sorting domain-containing protein [Corallincola holothuriorum]TAA48114.1 PEP-CTERM sorting domain-containing protein [Corallincola spongiicola]